MIRLITLVKKYWAPLTLITLIAITFLSLLPADKLILGSGKDKLHHFIAYTALMFPAALSKPRNWIAYGFVFVAWSGAIELIQPYVNRYGEWMDFVANTAGVICGVSIAMIINLIISGNRVSTDVK